MRVAVAFLVALAFVLPGSARSEDTAPGLTGSESEVSPGVSNPGPVEASPDPEQSGSEEGYRVYRLGEIVVSADMPAVREIAISNEVTAEDIKATNSRTAAEALTYVPGVVVTTGRKNEPEISIHGLEQRKAVLLIDGVPYYETNYGKLDLNQMPAELIARIDVIKGAPSVLYGPNAEAGVINIITKKGVEKPTFSAMFEGGGEKYYRTALTHGASFGKFYYWLNYVHGEYDAFRMSDDFDPEVGTLVTRIPSTPATFEDKVFENGGKRENSDRNTNTIWGKFGFELDEDSEYYANLSYIETEKGLPPSVIDNLIRPNDPFSQLARFDKYSDFNLDLSGRHKVIDPITLQGKFFYHRHIDDYVSYDDVDFSNQIGISRFKDYYVGGIALADFQPIDWDILRFALHFKQDSHKERDVRDNPFEESVSRTLSVGLENEFNLVPNLSIVAGGSYDWFKVTEDVDGEDLAKTDSWNFTAGAFYTFPDSTKVYGSAARKTRFPTLDQLFSGRSGNPSLDAENSFNYTIGVSRPFGSFAVAEAAYFFHDIEDWISRDGRPGSSLYRNYAKIHLQGLELGTEIYPLEKLTIKFGYTFLHSEDKSSNRVTDKVVRMPKHKVDLGVTYEVPYTRTRIDVTNVFVDEAYSQLPTPESPTQGVLKSDHFYFMNGRLTQPFMEHFEAYVAVNNMWDSNYEPEAGYPAPGRSWWIGLTAKF